VINKHSHDSAIVLESHKKTKTAILLEKQASSMILFFTFVCLIENISDNINGIF